jgi:4-hydroxysphinganine ceramide fatty acyl 2-hydroxylase
VRSTRDREIDIKGFFEKMIGGLTISMSKRIRIYTAEDVARHSTAPSCWVTRGGKVYDVSAFLPDHPGGEDLILNYGGKSVEDIMQNPDQHDHSGSAYDMLEEYVIGRLGNDESIVRDGECIAVIVPVFN